MKTQEKSKNVAYLLGTIHYQKISTSNKLAKILKSCSAAIIENPERNNYFNKENLKIEPLTVIGLFLYDNIILRDSTDSNSFKKLVNSVNKKLELHEEFDININKEIKNFHKWYNYILQIFNILILVCLALIETLWGVDFGFIFIRYIVVILLIIFTPLIYFGYFVVKTLDYRNKLAADGAVKIIKQGHKKIIIQYGYYHIKGIKKNLEKAGINVFII